MKKIFFCGLLLILSATSFSQQMNPSTSMTRVDYLQKSKHQKTTATILLVGGVSCAIVIPLAWALTTAKGIGFPVIAGIFAAGLIAIPLSIPFYIASSRNKKKGLRLSFKTEETTQVLNRSFVTRSLPSLGLKIGL